MNCRYDDFFRQLPYIFFAVGGGSSFPIPTRFALKLESGGARRVGQRLYFPVITKASTVKYHSFDVFLQTSFSEKGTDFDRCLYIGIGPVFPFHARFHSRSRSDGSARRVVDHLRIDMLAGEMHREPRTLRGTRHAPANACMSNLNAINRLHCTPKGQTSSRCLPASLLLDCLAFLAEDLFTGVPNPFSFVWFRRVIRPDIGGDLANHLFVYSFDQKFCVFLNGDLDPVRNREHHW